MFCFFSGDSISGNFIVVVVLWLGELIMKGLQKSKLSLTLITLVILASAIAIPLSSNISRSHAAPSSSQGSWQIVSSPSPSNSTNPATHYNVLQSVSTYDASHAWAVGWYRNTDGSDHDLIEHWDGTSWSLQAGANPGVSINILYGVKALSATNVWAVGYYLDTNSNQNILIEHSTDGGQTWTQDTNSYSGGGVLYSVDGDPSTGDAWAVGTNNSALTLQLVNGHFSQQSNISQNSSMVLYGVSEQNSSDVWAVGWRHADIGGVQADTIHYDGSSWTEYSSPNFSPNDVSQLYGVDAIDSTDAWAVGVNFSSSSPTGTLVHWDGSAWSTPINAGYTLGSIASTTSNNLWAAGSNDGSSPLIYYSSDGGSNWNQFTPGGTATFNGITFDKNSGIGWVVGAGSNSNSLTDTLIEQYTPSTPPPSITANPTQGTPGTEVTVTGNNWTTGDVIDISLSTSSSILTKATVASDGTFSASFTVPQDAVTGTQFVNAKDETTGQTAQTSFTVISPIPTFCKGANTANLTCLATYAGYGARGLASGYINVKSSWKVPHISCPQTPFFPENSFASFWVGLGGVDVIAPNVHAPLEQIGIVANCVSTFLTPPGLGKVTYQPFFEMFTSPQSQGTLFTTACSDSNTQKCVTVNAIVHENDAIDAKVSYQSKTGNYLLTMHDITQKWYTGGNGTSVPFQRVPGNTPTARSSAECIVEDPVQIGSPLPNLADFGVMSFSGCQANNKPIGSMGSQTIQFVMVAGDGTVKAQPSPLKNSTAFTVTWKNAGP